MHCRGRHEVFLLLYLLHCFCRRMCTFCWYDEGSNHITSLREIQQQLYEHSGGVCAYLCSHMLLLLLLLLLLKYLRDV
jgi:hypothetical protein